MNRCRFEGCEIVVPQGIARCYSHRLRWLPGKSVEPIPMSPFVRRALARELPAKSIA